MTAPMRLCLGSEDRQRNDPPLVPGSLPVGCCPAFRALLVHSGTVPPPDFDSGPAVGSGYPARFGLGRPGRCSGATRETGRVVAPLLPIELGISATRAFAQTSGKRPRCVANIDPFLIGTREVREAAPRKEPGTSPRQAAVEPTSGGSLSFENGTYCLSPDEPGTRLCRLWRPRRSRSLSPCCSAQRSLPSACSPIACASSPSRSS